MKDESRTADPMRAENDLLKQKIETAKKLTRRIEYFNRCITKSQARMTEVLTAEP